MMHRALIGLLLAASIVCFTLAAAPWPNAGCTTDTECAELHGGDGGPEPAP